MGLALGVTAGLALGLLAAPMRGSAMRARLRDRAAERGTRLQSLASSSRDWAAQALERGWSLLEQGRRALRTTEAAPLHATMGEIATMHNGTQPSSYGVTS
jgi:gas vesicle protein